MSEADDRPLGPQGMTDNLDLHDVASNMELDEAEARARQRFPEMIKKFTEDKSGKLITFPNRGESRQSIGDVLENDSSPRETLCYALPLDIDAESDRETAHLLFSPDGSMVRVEDQYGEEAYQEIFGASEEPYDNDALRVHDYDSAKSHFLDMHHRYITHRSNVRSNGPDFDEFLNKAFTNTKDNPPQPRQERKRRAMLGVAAKAINAYDRHFPGQQSPPAAPQGQE